MHAPLFFERAMSEMPEINSGAEARRLVTMVVAGQIANAIVRQPFRIGRDGALRVVPGPGGIVLDCRIGDLATGMAGDHVEPGVSLQNSLRDAGAGGRAANRGLLLYSCIGNRARVISGPAAGAVGTVTGKHGGIDHVLVDFEPSILRRLQIGDRVQIAALGQGLVIKGMPSIDVLNCSPRLLRRWRLRRHGGHLHVPVTHVIPGGLLGSGLGRSSSVLGDVDIELPPHNEKDRLRLRTLRLGDLVALCGVDARFGPTRRSDRLTVGIVVHGDSFVSGHGPGITPLLAAPRTALLPVHDPDANLAVLLGLRKQTAAVSRTLTERQRRIWRSVVAVGAGLDG